MHTNRLWENATDVWGQANQVTPMAKMKALGPSA